MRYGTLLAAAWLAALTPLAGQTRQETYNAAQAAFDKSEWLAAARGFERILAPAGTSGRTDGQIRTRYATALGMLGRDDEAVTEATRALGEFPAGKADPERTFAALSLAKLLRASLRQSEAIAAFENVRDDPSANADARFEAAVGVIQTASVFDPPRAVKAADLLIADPAYVTATKTMQASIVALKARSPLNGGDPKAAKATISKAVTLSGAPGSSARVNLLQAAVRGDAALIYARAGDPDQARLYLAHSGGGYLPETNWWGDGNRQPPVCDETVRPDDVAVVAFAIDEEGKPVGAEPVYASRPGPMGAVFARAVRGWDPSSAATKLSPFWRYSLRIEMRCVTRPAPMALAASFRQAAVAWLASRNLRLEDLAKAEKGVHRPADSLLVELHDLLKGRASDAALVKADRLLADAGAPPDARAYLLADKYDADNVPAGNGAVADAETLPERIEGAPGGGRAAAWLRIEQALVLNRAHRYNVARPLLERIVAMPDAKLDHDDAIRMVATLQLAIIDERRGMADAAISRLRQAGLDAEQCSAFDVHPLPINTSISDDIFPTEANRWGFDGFVREAYDIAADGHVAGVRTVMAYPPFVFGDVSRRAVAGFRYQPPTLDGKVLGCSAKMTSIRFKSSF